MTSAPEMCALELGPKVNDDSTRVRQLEIDDKCTRVRQLQKTNDDSTRVR